MIIYLPYTVGAIGSFFCNRWLSYLFMEEEKVVRLDVRELEPPMPMVEILRALDSLREGEVLEVIGLKPFKHLLPRLEEAGYRYLLREVEQGYLLRIWR